MTDLTGANVPGQHTFRVDSTLPRLIIPHPYCSHCGQDVTIDDGVAWCTSCRVQWDRGDEDAPARPDPDVEGSELPCGVVAGRQDEPYTDLLGRRVVPGPPQPCILPVGHTELHLCPYDVEVTHA